MYYIVDILKAAACLLIVNFHSDILYPDNLAILAFGGDIGNNIFFMVSGFTLVKSVEKETKVWTWYKKRLIRLFPILALFYVLSWLSGEMKIDSISDALEIFIFPTLYWFTGAILIFYLLFWVVQKYTGRKFQKGIIIALILGSIVVYDNIFSERYFMGFTAMLAGALIRNSWQKTGKVKWYHAVITYLSYFVLKLMRAKEMELFGLIHCCIGCMTIGGAAQILILGCRSQERMEKYFEKHQKLYDLVKKISQCTLAVYLLTVFHHRVLMRMIMGVTVFPVSYIVNLALSLGLAYFITISEEKLKSRFY